VAASAEAIERLVSQAAEKALGQQSGPDVPEGSDNGCECRLIAFILSVDT